MGISPIAKIKQVCSINFMPRLVCDKNNSVPWKFQKLSVRSQRRVRKTFRASSSKMNTKNEKCQQVIDRVFELNPPLPDQFALNVTRNRFALLPPQVPMKIKTDYEKRNRTINRGFVENPKIYDNNEHHTSYTKLLRSNEENLLKKRVIVQENLEMFNLNTKQKPFSLLTPRGPPTSESNCEICQKIINAIFDDNTDKSNILIDAYSSKTQMPQTETVHATTSKDNEEKLVQKIENLEVSSVVEAPTSEIADLNMNPRMLGIRKGSEDISITCQENSLNRYPSLDDLARRCLDSPTKNIDERLLKEMEKLGLLSSGLDYLNNSELVQNLEQDLMTRRKHYLEGGLHIKLSPPYELSIRKTYNNSLIETKSNVNNKNATKENPYNVLSNQKNELKSSHQFQDIHENNRDFKTVNQNEKVKIEVIRNLLQTRIEHLTQEKVKLHHLMQNVAQNVEPDTHADTELKLERFAFIKENTNILMEDEALVTESGIQIRDHNMNESRTINEVDADTVKSWNIPTKEEFFDPNLFYSDLKCSDQTQTNCNDQYMLDCNTEIQTHDFSIEKKYEVENTKQYKAEDPILAVETSRLQPYSQECAFLENEPEALKQASDSTKLIHLEKLVNPCIHEETAINKYIESEIPALELSDSNTKEETTLSELLRRVRERNKLAYFREHIVKMQGVQYDVAVGKCGTKPPPCPPPAPVCPKPPEPVCPPPKPKCPPSMPPCPCPQQKPVCPSQKPVCPKPNPKPPCNEPSKPKCPPAPCTPNPKCPHTKKLPCNKCQTCSVSDKIYDALTLLSYMGPHLSVSQKNIMPIFACAAYLISAKSASRNKIDFTDVMSQLKNSWNVAYTKSYEPWSPIPSLPFPEKISKKTLVCPKDGCKVSPPKLNAPCNLNPCINFPKPNSLTKR